jgi:hypothetical protein
MVHCLLIKWLVGSLVKWTCSYTWVQHQRFSWLFVAGRLGPKASSLYFLGSNTFKFEKRFSFVLQIQTQTLAIWSSISSLIWMHLLCANTVTFAWFKTTISKYKKYCTLSEQKFRSNRMFIWVTMPASVLCITLDGRMLTVTIIVLHICVQSVYFLMFALIILWSSVRCCLSLALGEVNTDWCGACSSMVSPFVCMIFQSFSYLHVLLVH